MIYLADAKKVFDHPFDYLVRIRGGIFTIVYTKKQACLALTKYLPVMVNINISTNCRGRSFYVLTIQLRNQQNGRELIHAFQFILKSARGCLSENPHMFK